MGTETGPCPDSDSALPQKRNDAATCRAHVLQASHPGGEFNKVPLLSALSFKVA